MIIPDFLLSLRRKPQGILLVVCCILLVSCQNDLRKLPPDTTLKDLESDRATDVTFIRSEKGRTKAKLHTNEFIKNDNAKPPYIDMLKGLKMELYDDSLRVESTITARSARYYPKEGNVIARDSVVVVNKEGKRLQTEELIWNQKLERIYTEKFVRITIDNQITYGDGIEANQDFTWFRIKKQRGTIPVAKEEFPTAE
jgi:LPS export ABC transporter protein LptC